MVINFMAKSASHSFIYVAFRNELEYRNVDRRTNIGDDLATSCENLVNFGSVTPEISLLICVPVSKICRKSAYPAKYLRMYMFWDNPHQILGTGTPLGGMLNLTFFLW